MGHHSVLIKYLILGEEVAEDADFSRIAKIVYPGDYVVQVERAGELYSSLHIKSNKIVIHVEP